MDRYPISQSDLPVRGDRATFSTKFAALWGKLPGLIDWIVSAVDQCYLNATTQLSLSALRDDVEANSQAYGVMPLAGDVTKTGVVTFGSSPVIPDATASSHPAAYGQVATSNAVAVKTALNAAGDAPIYACRAWLTFSGTGTVTINAAGNIASVVRNSAGNYSVTFATSMQNAGYAVIGGGGRVNAIYSDNLGVTINVYARSIDGFSFNTQVAGQGGYSSNYDVLQLSVIVIA